MIELAQLRADLEEALRRLDHIEKLKEKSFPSPMESVPRTDHVALALRAARCRKQVAPDISECGWIILLDLYAHHMRRTVSISSACLGSTFPTTTALRWIDVLTSRGLVEKRADASDGRRIYLCLTPMALELIEQWTSMLAGSDGSVSTKNASAALCN